MGAHRARRPLATYVAEPRVMVDSNILIDVVDDDPDWAEWSMRQLEPLITEGKAVINPIVFAEVAANFGDLESVERALDPFKLRREALPWEAAFLAGQVYKLYRKRGGVKRSPLPDFSIGAHASIAGLTLLTRDARRYREYFPKLKLVSPDGIA